MLTSFQRPLSDYILCLCLPSRVVRKSIARVLTVINQTQKENLRKFYKVSNMDEVHLEMTDWHHVAFIF